MLTTKVFDMHGASQRPKGGTLTSDELRQLRTSLGLTRKALAALLPVHWRTLLKWESGERKISAMAVKLLEQIRQNNKQPSNQRKPEQKRPKKK
jgi:DNA-binding transcriptional regulator YiaG